MLEFWQKFLTSQKFIPHGHCYLWQSNLVGLHILSDSLIALAYYSIPCTIFYFLRQRQDFPFSKIFLLFALFIIMCGTTHLMEIWTLWHPIYWLSGAIKAITAVVSIYTASELINLIPKALAFPSPAQLEAINQKLEKEIYERQQVEEALRRSEQRWQLAIAGTNEAIWDWDISNNQTFRSDRWFEMLGYEPQELSNQDDEWSKRIHPDDYEGVMAAQDAYLQQTAPNYHVEYRLLCKDGNYRWFRSKAKAIWNEQGNVVRMVGSIGDITERKQTELEIIRSRDLREAIFNESTDALFLVDSETLLTIDCNQRAVELFAANSKAELIGIEGQSLQKRQFTCVELANIVEQIQQQGFWSQEIEYVTKQGNSFWGNIAAKQIYVAEHVMNLVRVTDISDAHRQATERKLAEQALQEKENFLRSIYDGVAQSIFVVDIINHDFYFAGLNPAHETLTGIRSDELQGKTPEQILSPTVAAVVRQHYQDCLTAGTTITYEECLPFQNQETWWITSLTPLQDNNSRIYRIVGSSINITDQKRAQQMLELQAVVTRNMAEGICLVRVEDGMIVYANPKFEQMFGYDTNELTGQNVSIVNYADEQTTAQAVNLAITHAALQNGEVTYEVHNVKKDGTPFWCSATTSVFEHPEYGKVLVAVQQDITEHKQAQAQIQASLKEKEVLLKEIHHRVKNNLGIVSSLLQMQCRRTEDLQAMAILRDSQNRIASIALVHEKLYRSANLANIDFAQYIPDLTTHLFDSYKVSSNSIKLDIQVDDARLDIETAIPCGLIINELVSNALKYAFPAHRTGEIQVKLSHQDQQNFILIIRDNGIGLPADFEHQKGKTLGMTLVRGLVQQLRGTVKINSQQGTEFEIKFAKIRV